MQKLKKLSVKKNNFSDFYFASPMCKQMTKNDDHIEFDTLLELHGECSQMALKWL